MLYRVVATTGGVNLGTFVKSLPNTTSSLMAKQPRYFLRTVAKLVKAVVCKTTIMGSTPIRASIFVGV